MPNAVAMAACWEWEECPLSTPSQKEALEREEMDLILSGVPGLEGEERGL